MSLMTLASLWKYGVGDGGDLNKASERIAILFKIFFFINHRMFPLPNPPTAE